MHVLRLNNKGFGGPYLLLAIVVIAGIVAAGFMVYRANQKSKKPNLSTQSTNSQGNQSSKNQPSNSQTAVDPYAGWQQYCSKLEKACFKYPADWKTGTYEVADPSGEGFSVSSPNSAVTLYFSSVISGLGGQCGTTTDTVISSSVQELTNAKGIGVHSALYKEHNPNRAKPTTYKVILGLSDDLKNEPAGSSVGCVSVPTFLSKTQKSSSNWTVGFTNSLNPAFRFQSFDTQADAQSLMAAAEFTTAQKILGSYSY